MGSKRIIGNRQNVIEEAHRLLDLGYTAIPALPEKKHPPFAWLPFQKKQPSHEELDSLFEEHPAAWGLGIVTTGLLIVDIDPQKDGSPNPFPENPDHRKNLFAAPTVRTPRRGCHHYFRLPPGLVINNSVGKIAPNVDIRTDGGFLMAPPTVRKDGAYIWIDDRGLQIPPSELSLPPDFILEKLVKSKSLAMPSPVPSEGPIMEGNRDDTLFRLASKWRGKGLEIPEILELLRLHNRNRCSPPLSDKQLAKIAKSAGKYTPNEPPEPSPEVVDPGPLPNRLFRVPGFISDVMDLTLRTAPRPNIPLAFAGAITLLGTLAGRKVRTESDLRTNIYVIGLGDSGVGKDQPRKVCKTVMFGLGLGDGVIGSVASGQALEDEVQKEPACLALMDEMDELMISVRKDKSGSRQNLPKVMMELFTSANVPYQTRAKANVDRYHVDQPNLCIFGTAVPQHFYDSLSARMMDDGFLARSLIIEAGKLGPRQNGAPIEIPSSLLDVAEFWYRNDAQLDWNHEHPDPRTVSPDTEGYKVLEQAADDFDETRREAQERGDNSAVSLWARAWEHTSKLALLYAISVDHKNPVITRDAALWAVDFTGHHTRRLLATIHGRVSENEFHALLIKAKNKIRNSPQQTMGRSQLIKNMHVSARDLDQVITVLYEGGEIELLKGDPDKPNSRGAYYKLVSP